MSTWSITDMFVKSCGVCDKYKYSIIVPQTIQDAFLTLLKEIKTEWLCYLVAEKHEETKADGTVTGIIYTIESYYIPPQQVSTASVKVLDSDVPDVPEDRVIGVIHAHQFTSSKPHFSGVDKSFVNSNNEFSLVINRNGEYEAVSRQKTECDKWMIVSAEVFVQFQEQPEVVTELRSKIKTYTRTPYKGGAKSGPGSRSHSGKGSKTRTRSNIWNSQKTLTTTKRISNCPHEEAKDYDKCEVESYYGCKFYNPACPKKNKVEAGTVEIIAPPDTEEDESSDEGSKALKQKEMKELLLPEEEKPAEEDVAKTPVV